MKVGMAIAMAAALLPGCVAQQMASAVGRPVDDVVRFFGPPAEIEELPSRNRLYVWTRRADLRRGPSPLTDFRPVATGEFDVARHLYGTGKVCAFRLIARRDETTGRWMVREMMNPGVLCT